MCFSAHASLIVGATLSIIGIASLLKAHTNGFRLLALSPILLGIQQALEGLVWLRINAGDITSTLFKIGVYGFQFFAAAFWPLWIPLVLYIVERKTNNKGILGLLSCIGFAMHIIALIALWKSPVIVQVVDHHLRYPFLIEPLRSLLPLLSTWQIHALHYVELAMYMMLVIGSCFVSTIPGIYIIGILFSIGYIVAMLGYSFAFASTWCFFSAIASASVYGVIVYNNRNHS
jgi:hypothetical protein